MVNESNHLVSPTNAVLYFLPTMEKYIHSRKNRVQAKRRDVIESAIATVEAVAEGRIDPYEGWQKVCGISK